jgi:hypothetical protein
MISTMGHGEEFLNRFVNYERKGVPSGAGTDTKDGFDLVTYRLDSCLPDVLL